MTFWKRQLKDEWLPRIGGRGGMNRWGTEAF